jgi:hypothetical protein
VAKIDLNQVTRWHSAGTRDALALLATGGRSQFAGLISDVSRDLPPTGVGIGKSGLDPLLMLAYALINLPLVESDGRDGTRIFEYVVRHGGIDAIARLSPLKRLRVTGAALNAYWSRGNDAAYRRLVGQLTTNGWDTDNVSRGINLRHPRLGVGSEQAWLDKFNGAFFHSPGWAVEFQDRHSPCIDEILTHQLPADPDDTLVSVILTTYNTGPALTTAVRSVLHQTHESLELVVVDDHSSSTDHLDFVAAMDSRVRIIRMPENRGTYAARNVGIDATRGPLVTFQDSDDWSHPMRLETQVKALRADPRLHQVLGYSVFTAEDLYLRDSFEPIQIAGSTMMFRRDQVNVFGYFDEVRRSADSEYIARLATAGADTVLQLSDVPLSIVRRGHSSLTQGEITNGWVHPARSYYRHAWLAWHDSCAATGIVPRMAVGDRPFVIPTRNHAEPRPFPGCDVVVLLNCVAPGDAELAELTSIVVRARADGVAVAIGSTYPAKLNEGWHPAVQGLVDGDVVHPAFIDDGIDARTVVVLTPRDLQVPPALPCHITTEQLLVHVRPPVAGPADLSWVAMVTRPPATSSPGDQVSLESVVTVLRDLFGTDPVAYADDDVVEAVRVTLAGAHDVRAAGDVLAALV